MLSLLSNGTRSPSGRPRAPSVRTAARLCARSLAILLGTFLWSEAGRAQDRSGMLPDTSAPAVLVFPEPGTIRAPQNAYIDSIVFCDATGYSSSTFAIRFNGQDLTAGWALNPPPGGGFFEPQYRAVSFPGCASTMVKRFYDGSAVGSFQNGENVLEIHLCDRWYCTDVESVWTYLSNALPRVSFPPPAVTPDQTSATVTVLFDDDRGLDPPTAKLTRGGVAVTGCAYTAASATIGQLVCTVPLSVGSNALAAEIRDSDGETNSATTAIVRDHAAPQISFAPDSLRTSDAQAELGVSISDDGVIDQARTHVLLNGVLVYPTPAAPLPLKLGFNTLEATACDQSGRCTTRRARHLFRYTAERANPVFTTVQPQVEDRLVTPATEPAITYTTPSYISLDEPRSLTLVHAAHQARASVLIQADVEDRSSTPPDAMSIRVLNADYTVNQTLSHGGLHHYYRGANGVNRLAARLELSHLPTGVYEFGVAVDSWWNTPSGWVGNSVGAVRKVRVLVVNERASPIAPGWSLAGLQRVHVHSDTAVMVTAGDGSALYFRKAGVNAAGEATFTSPAGERSSLVWIPSALRYERRYPDGLVARFDGVHRLRALRERTGDSITFVYDAGGKLTSVIDPAGQATTLEYHWDWALARIIDPAGRTSHLAYGGSSRYALTHTDIYAPDGARAMRVQYDTLGRLTGWVDRAGGEWSVTTDQGGELKKLTMPQVVADGALRNPKVQVRSYAAAVLPAAANAMTSPFPSVRPEEAWVVLEAPNTDSVAYVPDRWGLPMRLRDEHGRDAWVFRDTQGRDSVVVSAEGDTTRYAYQNGKLSLVSGPRGSTELSYGSFEQLTQVSGNAGSTRYHLNGLGMLDSIVAPGHMKLSYTRDARGRPLTATDGAGRVFRFRYQPGGLQNLDTVYTPTGATALRRDAAGRTDRVTNALGQTGTITFDAVNRPLTVTDNLQQVTALSYGAVRMDTVRDARQQVYGFLSNVLGWDTVRVDPRGGRTVTAYRTDGRPTEVTNRRGQRISFEYDDQGRPVRQIHDRAGTSLRDTISFSYDSVPAGRVVNTRDSGSTFGADTAVSMLVVRNAASADTLYFSQEGRPMQQVAGRAGGHRYTLTTTYADSVGLPRRLDWEEGGIQLQSWDYQMVGGYPGIPGLVQIPRLVGVTYASPSDPRIVGLPHPAGENRQYAPTSSFLRGITFTHPVANEKAGFLYHYDALGRVTERIRAAQDTAWLFRYDAAGRLAKYGKATVAPGTCVTNATGTACQLNADSVFTAGYTYDAVGNPNWFSDVLIETGNRLTRFGGWTMTYDADGNVTRKNNGASDYRFHWNALGQMDSMQVFNGAGARLGSVSYAYDGLGRRVRKTGPTGDVGFVYDGQQVALEVNPSTGAVTTRYAYYPGIDQPAYLVRDGKRYHYLRDHQGSITALVDSTGTPVNRYRYGPYGAPELRQETVPQRFAYTGREFEPEYGMYYYRARYYDPMAGRFMSEDPIGLGGGINSYAYVGQEPINQRDPFGLCPDCIEPLVVTARQNSANEWRARMFLTFLFGMISRSAHPGESSYEAAERAYCASDGSPCEPPQPPRRRVNGGPGIDNPYLRDNVCSDSSIAEAVQAMRPVAQKTMKSVVWSFTGGLYLDKTVPKMQPRPAPAAAAGASASGALAYGQMVFVGAAMKNMVMEGGMGPAGVQMICFNGTNPAYNHQ